MSERPASLDTISDIDPADIVPAYCDLTGHGTPPVHQPREFWSGDEFGGDADAGQTTSDGSLELDRQVRITGPADESSRGDAGIIDTIVFDRYHSLHGLQDLNFHFEKTSFAPYGFHWQTDRC